MTHNRGVISTSASLMNRLQEEMLAPILSKCSAGELMTLLYSTILIKPLNSEFQKFVSIKPPIPTFDSSRWQPAAWNENTINGILPVEQTACLIITGGDYLSAVGLILVELLHGGGLLDLIDVGDFAFEASNTAANGFELIGIKYQKNLTQLQARGICPFELGDSRFLPRMISYYDQPCCCVILRRFNAVNILQEYRKKLKKEREVEIVITNSAPWTHHVIRSFFDVFELYQDKLSRPHAKFLPKRGELESIEKSIFDQRVDVVKSPLLIPPRLCHRLPQVMKKLENLNLRLLSMRLFPQLDENAAIEIISSSMLKGIDQSQLISYAEMAFQKLWLR